MQKKEDKKNIAGIFSEYAKEKLTEDNINKITKEFLTQFTEEDVKDFLEDRNQPMPQERDLF